MEHNDIDQLSVALAEAGAQGNRSSLGALGSRFRGNDS